MTSWVLAVMLLAGGQIFEVASVRRNTSGTTQTNMSFTQGGVAIINLQLRAIIQFAYGISQPSRLAGVPDWANTERFDVVARGTITSIEDRRAMLQALLAERFKLSAHTEQRNVPIFTLVLTRSDGRLGPSLTPSSRNCTGRGRGEAGCGVRSAGPGEIKLTGIPVSQLAAVLSATQGRPVIDRTELSGTYDIELVFAPENPFPGRGGDGPPVPEGRASLVTAIQEQLGLKLQSGNQAQDVLVIDGVSHPTEN